MATNKWLAELPFFKISNADMSDQFSSTLQSWHDNVLGSNLASYLKKITGSGLFEDLAFDYYTTNALNSCFAKVKESNELSVLHLNIRSLNANQQSLLMLLAEFEFKFDIIVLSEIWSYNVEFFHNIMNGYDFFYELPKISKVGGVGIFLKNDILCTVRNDLKLPISAVKDEFEDLWIEIEKGKTKYILAGIYRHPNTDINNFINKFEKNLNYLSKMKCSCIVAGDFNIDLSKYQIDKNTDDYLNNLILHDFLPVVVLPTRITSTSASIIDHIYYHGNSHNSQLKILAGNIFADVSDHLPNFILINNEKKRCICHNNDRPLIRIFSEKNGERFRNELCNINWDGLLCHAQDPNLAYEIFHKQVLNKFNKCYPLQHLSRRATKDQAWVTKGLKTSSRHKNKLYKKWIKSRRNDDFEKYRIYKTIFKRVTRACMTTYYKDTLNTKMHNVKKVWNELNKLCSFSKKNAKRIIIPKLLVNGKESTKQQEIVQEFNNYFCEVGNNLLQSLQPSRTHYRDYMTTSISDTVFLEPVDDTELRNLILSLNGRKTPGYDNISARLIQGVVNEITKPLLYIYNLSISAGIVPDKLKIAKVIPVYKKGEKSLASNYRPISLLSVFDKILEKLIYKRLMSFLKSHNVLYKYQFGFRSNHSTSLALVDVIDELYKQLDANNYVCGIFFDLQKAFDTVNHEILLDKLRYYGIRGTAFNWIKNYLSNRFQFVSIGNVQSKLSLITCGVPQGSVLGPLLFLLYVNDICNAVVDHRIKLFADDTNLFISGKSITHLVQKTNEELAKLNDWFLANKLSLNIDKTFYSLYSPNKTVNLRAEYGLDIIIEDKKITQVKTSKYLGLFLDEKLSWIDHIQFVKEKLLKFIGLFL